MRAVVKPAAVAAVAIAAVAAAAVMTTMPSLEFPNMNGGPTQQEIISALQARCDGTQDIGGYVSLASDLDDAVELFEAAGTQNPETAQLFGNLTSCVERRHSEIVDAVMHDYKKIKTACDAVTDYGSWEAFSSDWEHTSDRHSDANRLDAQIGRVLDEIRGCEAAQDAKAAETASAEYAVLLDTCGKITDGSGLKRFETERGLIHDRYSRIAGQDPEVSGMIRGIESCHTDKTAMVMDRAFYDYAAVASSCGAVYNRSGYDNVTASLEDAQRSHPGAHESDRRVEGLFSELESCMDKKRTVLDSAIYRNHEKVKTKCEAVRDTHDYNLMVQDYNEVVVIHPTYPSTGPVAVLIHDTTECMERKLAMVERHNGGYDELPSDIPNVGSPKATHRIHVNPDEFLGNGPAAAEAAAALWEESNPGMKFEFVEREHADVTIVWTDWLDEERVGLFNRHRDSVWDESSGTYQSTWDDIIQIKSGDYDCNGEYHTYAVESATETIAHELGHHLGMGHIDDEEHLMYGDMYPDPVPPESFDDFGYTIPENLTSEFGYLFEGDQKEWDRLDRLDKEMASHTDTQNEMESELEAHASRGWYEEYNLLVSELNSLIDEYNDKVEESNELADWLNCRYVPEE